jgi:hypothetical protein
MLYLVLVKNKCYLELGRSTSLCHTIYDLVCHTIYDLATTMNSGEAEQPPTGAMATREEAVI